MAAQREPDKYRNLLVRVAGYSAYFVDPHAGAAKRNHSQNGARILSDVLKGLVFNVQKFSLHDGPGIRTIVFLKGCPLACVWCSNPEGQSRAPELIHSYARCIGTEECDRCVAVCLEKAIRKDDHGGVIIDRERCDACGDCAHVCPLQRSKFQASG